jgi:hypothetical protein
LRHFIPVFSRRDTIALRAVTMFTGKRAGRQKPFSFNRLWSAELTRSDGRRDMLEVP